MLRKTARILWLALTFVLLMALSTNVAMAGWDWDDSVKQKGGPHIQCSMDRGGSLDYATGWDWDDTAKCKRLTTAKPKGWR